MICNRFDSFTKNSSEGCDQTIYFLTHADTDHANIPLHVQQPVYCSPETKHLLPKQKNLKELKYGHNIVFYPDGKPIHVYMFPVTHVLGSAGFYTDFDKEMYIGDARLDFKVKQAVETFLPKKIVIDNTFIQEKEVFPSLKTSAQELQSKLKNLKINKIVVHSLAVVELLKHARVKIRNCKKLSPHVVKALEYYNLVDGQSTINAISKKCLRDENTLIPSMLYYVKGTKSKENFIRMKLSTHATEYEYKKFQHFLRKVYN